MSVEPDKYPGGYFAPEPGPERPVTALGAGETISTRACVVGRLGAASEADFEAHPMPASTD